MLFDVHSVMRSMSETSPIFRSEFDFQNAFAKELKTRLPDAEVRLEDNFEERSRIDIVVRLDTICVAIELKYRTNGLNFVSSDGDVILRTHGAADHGRYDFIKDIGRLERFVAVGPKRSGIAVMLTNDHSFWDLKSGEGRISHAFRIAQGISLKGLMEWTQNAGSGSTKNREKPLELNNGYFLHWQDYSVLDAPKSGIFRYLAVPVL